MGTRLDFNKDWKFFLGDLAPRTDTAGWGGAKARAYDFGATAERLDDSGWRPVTLPHDFVVEGNYVRKPGEGNEMQSIPEMESVDSRHMAGGLLEGNVAWYRKRFALPKELSGKRVLLHFDGVYRNSTVYVNQYYVGDYENGYTSFYYDITDFLYEEGENLVAVRVDATGREGWWYEGGGIYRNVWLEVKEAVFLKPWGVFVNSAVDWENRTAQLEIRTEVSSKLLEVSKVTIESVIRNAEGAVVKRLESALELDAWAECENRVCTELADVQLWDLDNPYLYKLESKLYVQEKSEICNGTGAETGNTEYAEAEEGNVGTIEKNKMQHVNEKCGLAEHSYADRRLVDSCVTNFGLRDITFTPDNGMLLNGRKVSVKGLCCHHDHAGVGIAVPESVQEYRIAQMKRMGANGYRCAHYQPTTELLDICDRMGMLVLDETRRMSSAPRDIEQLRTLIKRDRNHPSVFLWAIGNEEIFCQDRKECAKTTITMRSEVRKLDPTRPITSAVVCWNGVERFEHAGAYIPVTKELDVMGFNYCKTAWDDYHEQMPGQPVIITEASSNSGTRGCYSTREEKGHYYIYDKDNAEKCLNKRKAVKLNMGEEEWKYFAERPYLAGIFLWTGIDYRGEPTPLSYPAISTQFGILDYCGFEKDNFYYYKSWWTEEPVLHVFPHWNLQGREGEPVEVYCYSNLEEAELFVNGRSYGRKAMERNWYLSWENVIYEPGTLMVKGYKADKEALQKTVETTKPAHAIQLTPYKEVLSGNEDAAIINVSIVDEAGRTVPNADNEITFTVEGEGEFLGVGNGNPGSHESDKVPVRRAFNGLCQLLVRTTGKPGSITVTAKSDGLKGGACTVTVM